MNEAQTPRRRFLKIGAAAIAIVPFTFATRRADAATNASMRSGLKYQGMPKDDKSCANCKQFVPGASADALGGCVIMPGDTEIAPQGYCVAWARKA